MQKPSYREMDPAELKKPDPAPVPHPGRTLPEGRQWLGKDVPGCKAQQRRLRQLQRGQLSTRFPAARQTTQMREPEKERGA